MLVSGDLKQSYPTTRLDHLEQENQQDQFYKFRAITGHKGPSSWVDCRVTSASPVRD